MQSKATWPTPMREVEPVEQTVRAPHDPKMVQRLREALAVLSGRLSRPSDETLLDWGFDPRDLHHLPTSEIRLRAEDIIGYVILEGHEWRG